MDQDVLTFIYAIALELPQNVRAEVYPLKECLESDPFHDDINWIRKVDMQAILLKLGALGKKRTGTYL